MAITVTFHGSTILSPIYYSYNAPPSKHYQLAAFLQKLGLKCEGMSKLYFYSCEQCISKDDLQ